MVLPGITSGSPSQMIGLPWPSTSWLTSSAGTSSRSRVTPRGCTMLGGRFSTGLVKIAPAAAHHPPGAQDREDVGLGHRPPDRQERRGLRVLLPVERGQNGGVQLAQGHRL
jgi:hypothetical protein